MTTIEENREEVTLINVFTVDPDDQQRLTDLLVEATEETMKDIPSYVSANIHTSFDGERVVNYAHWESAEAFEAMPENPEVAAHMEAASDIATADFHLYEVAYTHEAD